MRNASKREGGGRLLEWRFGVRLGKKKKKCRKQSGAQTLTSNAPFFGVFQKKKKKRITATEERTLTFSILPKKKEKNFLLLTFSIKSLLINIKYAPSKLFCSFFFRWSARRERKGKRRAVCVYI